MVRVADPARIRFEANEGLTRRMSKEPDPDPKELAKRAAEVRQGTVETDERVVKKDGKLVIQKDGESTDMKVGMQMDDGTKVMIDGTVIKPGGESNLMKEGDSVTSLGKVRIKEAGGAPSETPDPRMNT
jgi:hypothetical protein